MTESDMHIMQGVILLRRKAGRVLGRLRHIYAVRLLEEEQSTRLDHEYLWFKLHVHQLRDLVRFSGRKWCEDVTVPRWPTDPIERKVTLQTFCLRVVRYVPQADTVEQLEAGFPRE